MSQTENLDIKCPKCGHKDKVEVWRALNASLSPELKNDLLDGKMNFFECPVCKSSGFIPAPFVYHDMETELFIHYFPLESLDDDEMRDLFTPEGRVKLELGETAESQSIPDYIKNAKIVFSMEELVRYIKFRDRLSELNEHSNDDDI